MWLYRVHNHNPEQAEDNDDQFSIEDMLWRKHWFGGRIEDSQLATRVLNIIPELRHATVINLNGEKSFRSLHRFGEPSNTYRRICHFRGNYKQLVDIRDKLLYFFVSGRQLPYADL